MSDDGWDDDAPYEPPKESSYTARRDSGGGGGGRGGRGGGGGGGGGGRACYKCNEEGHMARDCPNEDTSGGGGRGRGGGGGGRACYKCNEEGHMARECPNEDTSGGGGRGGGGGGACYKCNEEGHMARDCPTGGGGGRGGGGGGACYKCNEEGHMARDCPTGGGGGGGGACYKCNEEGHMARDCPTGGGEESVHKGRGCYNCGEDGHMSKDCTNPRKENADRPPRRPREGGEGGEGDPKLENYIPPELLEGDAIFEERNKIFEGAGINFSQYQQIPHSITGENQVPSVETFEQLNLRPLILENLEKCDYKTPTPIQRHGSPQLMAGRHVMCCAQTGSGKTAAFLIPIINTLLNQQDKLSCAGSSPVKPEALILAPTRELAIQIANEANMYASGSILRTQVIYGGTATFALKNKLIRGCNILVATTGRLKQFINEDIVDLSNVTFFILDEADRMLDMGFMGDVDEIVAKMPAKEDRVSGMFSATFPDEVQTSAKKFLHDYVYIVIGVVGGACKDVVQEIIQVEKSDKRKKVLEIIRGEGSDTKMLIFCSSKKGADFLATHLATNQVSCTSIHGDRLQSQRETALREFTSGKRQVLVATAVAARGLDIPKVGLVINYDLPSEIDEYVHRIGRTGRVGHTGRAISFYDSEHDAGLIGSLMGILKGAEQNVPAFLEAEGANGGYCEGEFASTDVRDGGGAGASAAVDDEDDDWN